VLEALGVRYMTSQVCVPIFAHYVKTPDDFIDFVHCIAEACAADIATMPAFQTILHSLYQNDDELVTEASIMAW
jgi:predicted membrane protein